MATPATSGFLNLNKPAGPSSFAIVSLVRRLTGVRRVGHGGTLDPAADGVLVLCLGQATRMTEYLMDGRKGYVARLRLGIETDSYDALGAVLAQRDPSGVSLEDVRRALPAFTGHIRQVPPMYSALKHEGQRLYTLARQGIEVERAPREVSIYRIDVTRWEPPECTLTVECSRGTYVRSIAHDLGQVLGCGAHLQGLTRTGVGPFALASAVSPEGLAEAVRGRYWEALLYPLDEPILRMPAAILDGLTAVLVQDGRLCPWGETPGAVSEPANDDLCRAYSDEGDLVALMGYDGALRGWRPRKVFGR